MNGLSKDDVEQITFLVEAALFELRVDPISDYAAQLCKLAPRLHFAEDSNHEAFRQCCRAATLVLRFAEDADQAGETEARHRCVAFVKRLREEAEDNAA